MEQYILGSMISGALDLETHEFTVTKLKNISTHSVWSTSQMREMYESLTKVMDRGEDSLVIMTGTMPLLVNRQEMEALHTELSSVLSSFS